ncbi:MAG: chromosome segregation protein SMC [Eubacteriales bacterium]
MRLKSLELVGFKSFADRTVIDFGDGMTAIIGPNGSGKSNISDAVRFVLGEVSVKNIRGDRMEDVVFGGTDKRRAMNFAEVTLVLDNTGEQRIDLDYDEITVTRRYTKASDDGAGGSEYLLNRRPARLKDIQSLFMNTGLGKGGYSIIGQGRVAEILSQRSSERRGIFEEAAGIARYRSQKEDSERKLEAVGGNLDRVGDIMGELEARLPQLRTDAEKAKKYLDIYEKKKRAGISLALYYIVALKEKADECEGLWTAAKHRLDIADDNISALEQRTDAVYLTLQQLKAESDRKSRELREIEEKRQKLEGDVRVLENENEHIKESIQKAKTEAVIRRRALSELEEKAEEQKKTADEADALEKSLSDEVNRSSEAGEKLSETAAELEKQHNDLWDKIERAKAKARDAEIALSALEADRRNRSELKTRALEQEKALEDEIKLLKDRADRSEKSVFELDERLKSADSAISGFEAELGKVESEKAALSDALSQKKLEINSALQRADALKRMEELFEGYNASVKAVMSAAGRGELSGICGPLSRLITLKPRYTVAIETALGANIQNIVVEDEDAAKAAIALLKARNAGRATFYPITTMSGGGISAREEDLKKYKGYVGIADTLVDFDEKYRSVINYALGRTLVAEDIDCASEIARAYGYRLRIVTLDGQLINAGGSYTGGSVKRDSGMLTRSRDIDKAEKQAVALEIEADAIKTKLKENEDAAGKIKEDLLSARKDRELLSTLRSAENTQLEVLKNQYASDGQRLSAQREELRKITESESEYEERRIEGEKSLKAAEEETAKFAESLSGLEERKSVSARDISAQGRSHSALLVKFTAAQKDAESARRDFDFTLSSIKAAKDKLESGEAEMLEREKKLIENDNQASLDKAETERLKELARTMDEEIKTSDTSISEGEKQSGELSAEIKNRLREREQLYGEYARLDARRGTIQTDREKLVTSLWEEYELTPDSAAELGYPPLDAKSRAAAASELSQTRTKLRELGDVNVGAIDECREVEERFGFLQKQRDDLIKSREELTRIIVRLEGEMRSRFVAVFEAINENFRSTFRELFGGGDASLSMTDPTDPLSTGIEIEVAPPGKLFRTLSLLSGGEQAFAAIALFFAILKVNPTPFCILDEIEAALDDVNVVRFADYCRRYSDNTQFIAITHRRGTMEACDRLYGVTMIEKGISRILTLDINEAEKRIGKLK